jgi:pimeloyl-ACP methyl ester carboxylesterase
VLLRKFLLVRSDSPIKNPFVCPATLELNLPVLVLRGECDSIDWKVTRLYRDTIPNAKLVYIPRAGHVISDEQPEAYYQTIKAFLPDQAWPNSVYTGQDDPAKP